MDNFADSSLVISIIMIDSMIKRGMIPDHILNFEIQITSALATIFSTADKEDIPVQLQGLFEGSDEQIIERVRNSRKLQFAVQQFVSAYYQYDFFEAKYPETSKMLL